MQATHENYQILIKAQTDSVVSDANSVVVLARGFDFSAVGDVTQALRRFDGFDYTSDVAKNSGVMLKVTEVLGETLFVCGFQRP